MSKYVDNCTRVRKGGGLSCCCQTKHCFGAHWPLGWLSLSVMEVTDGKICKGGWGRWGMEGWKENFLLPTPHMHSHTVLCTNSVSPFPSCLYKHHKRVTLVWFWGLCNAQLHPPSSLSSFFNSNMLLLPAFTSGVFCSVGGLFLKYSLFHSIL